jgi:glycine/D-amino acid oxidase-like deaminating enzyme/nitrite reductase/ring-hydroxylating ferredoxin subunit
MRKVKSNSSQKNNPRDASTISAWQKEIIELPISDLLKHSVYDVLIIGGGITGITTALILQQEGKNCVLAEAHSIGYGATGGTSAHLNTFFDATYTDIEKKFSKDAAKLVADSGKEAFQMISDMVNKFSIDCDFEYKDAFLYSQNDDETKELDEIITSSKNAGIAVEQVSAIDIPVPFKKAYVFKKQGQFHPLKYIGALAKAFIKAGGVIVENTFIRKTEKQGDIHLAESDNLTIAAKSLVYATHIPPGINLMDFRNAPYRSYVLGIRLKNEKYPSGLAYDMKEPYHYFRTHVVKGKRYLLAGGEDHKTGHDDPEKAFKALEKYCRKYYDVGSVDFKWSAQYYVPSDGLPYIGVLPGSADETILMATGFNGNGMMFGTLSGRIISDAILGRENKYADLFSPSRIKPIAGFSDFVKENADVAYHFVADRLSASKISSLKRISPGTGEIVDYKDQKLAVYRSETGEIHALNPVCTHAKCIVNFNHAETSWDCPCHGGRFDIDGKVLTGPPRMDLQKIELDI